MTYPGNTWRLKAIFRNVAEEPTDPTTVKVIVEEPERAPETFQYEAPESGVVREGVGVYYKDVTPSRAGTVRFAWVGEGAVNAAEEQAFIINRGVLLPGG